MSFLTLSTVGKNNREYRATWLEYSMMLNKRYPINNFF